MSCTPQYLVSTHRLAVGDLVAHGVGELGLQHLVVVDRRGVHLQESGEL